MPRFLNVESFSHCSFSWKLLIASDCNHSLCHPASSHLMSSELFSPDLISLHLMSSLPFSSLLSWSQLLSSLLMSPELFSWFTSWFLQNFQSSSRLFSALRSWCQLILCLRISSLLFSHLLSSAHLSSPDLSSCQLVSHHLSSSQRTLVSSQLFSAPKPSSKTDLAPKQATPAFPQRSFRARLPSKTDSWRSENGAFVRDPPQNLKEEDVKAELSCETKKWKLKMCNTLQNGAFVGDFPQKLKVEDAKAELSCETSGFPQKLKVEDVKTKLLCETSFKKESSCKNEAWTGSYTARQIRPWSEHAKTVPQPSRGRPSPSIFRGTVCVAKHSKFGPSANLQNRISCETSLQNWKLKMWKRSFRGRRPSKSENRRCENGAFVGNFPQKLEVEDAKTKLSCETSIKNWQLKMWRRSFRANFLPRTESWRYENEAFVRNFPQNDMSLLWDPFATRSFCYEISLHCCETSLLWDLFAARSLCCEISLLWDTFAVRSLCNLFAVRLLLCCEISLLW